MKANLAAVARIAFLTVGIAFASFAAMPAQAAAVPTIRITNVAGMTVTVPNGKAAQNVILIARPTDSVHVPRWHQAFVWTQHGQVWSAEYAPKGVPSGFCMGQIQFSGWARLRHCRAGSPWQLWYRDGAMWRNWIDGAYLTSATYNGGEIYNHASLVGPPADTQKWSAW